MEDWEPWYYGTWTIVVVGAIIGLKYKPETDITIWAMEEAQEQQYKKNLFEWRLKQFVDKNE